MTFDPLGRPGGPPSHPTGDEGTGEWWEHADVPAWWEDGRGFGGDDTWAPFPRRRRSRVLQVTGIVVAAALILGSASTTLEDVLGGSAPATLPAAVRSTTLLPVATVRGSGSRAPVQVEFEVVNSTGSAVAPVCTVTVVRDGEVLGAVQVGRKVLGSIATGKRTVNHVVVMVPRSSLAGAEPLGEVACKS